MWCHLLQVHVDRGFLSLHQWGISEKQAKLLPCRMLRVNVSLRQITEPLCYHGIHTYFFLLFYVYVCVCLSVHICTTRVQRPEEGIRLSLPPPPEAQVKDGCKLP